MNKNSELIFLKDPAYKALCRHYINNPIAVYTGAGVSCSTNSKYGPRGWDELVKEALIQNVGPGAEAVATYENKVQKEWADEPWKAADWVADKIGNQALQQMVVEIIQQKEYFPDRKTNDPNKNPSSGKKRQYKQLGRPFLKEATTLNSVSAFCARFTGVVKDTKSKTYRVAPNPRVRAIVTSNYDPFLEAASATMFIRHRCKPVGAYGSSIGGLHQIPVFHIHGYVPYPEVSGKRKQRNIPAMVDPVITTRDYTNASENNAFNFTMGPQVHVLRHYCTLFVGFSFRDDWVNDLLYTLNKERAQRGKKRLYHFALMENSEIRKKGESFFLDHGIKPIGLANHSQIPGFFKQLYVQALNNDYGGEEIPLPLVKKRRGKSNKKRIKERGAAVKEEPPTEMKCISADDYWEDLYWCRNCAVKSRKKRAY